VTCRRFPLLKPPRPRGLLGAGASIGPIRALAIVCAGGVAIGGGVISAQPSSPPAWHAPGPAAVNDPSMPVPINAPGGVYLLGPGVGALLLMLRRRPKGTTT